MYSQTGRRKCLLTLLAGAAFFGASGEAAWASTAAVSTTMVDLETAQYGQPTTTTTTITPRGTANMDPGAQRLIVGKGLGKAATSSRRESRMGSSIYRYEGVYENEPVALSVESLDGGFMDLTPVVPERGFLNQTGSITIRPRGSEYEQVFYLADDQHLVEKNITVILKTVPSRNPRLYDVRSSVGYLDPAFKPEQYTYFLRVKEGTKSGKLRLTAIDDENTRCVYTDAQGMEQEIVGKGLTETITLTTPSGGSSTPNIIQLECVNAAAGSKIPPQTVRYLFQVVEQYGGSTRLTSLDVIGGDLQQEFAPTDHGLYTVNMMNSAAEMGTEDQPWISFKAVPENKKAVVTVEGYPTDSNGFSPYFRMGLGESRTFRVRVRTPENPVAEEYSVRVTRPSGSTWLSSLTHFAATCASIASSTRAHHFLTNVHLFQWLAISSRLDGVPEHWPVFSSWFNMFNWGIFTEYPLVTMDETYLHDPVGHDIHTTYPNANKANVDESIHVDGEEALEYGQYNRYVAPPQPYGFDIAQAALTWNGMNWAAVVSGGDGTDIQALERLRLQRAEQIAREHHFARGAKVDNPEFFGCNEADNQWCQSLLESAAQAVKADHQSFKRQLKAVEDLQDKSTVLEGAKNDQDNLLYYCRTLVVIGLVTTVVGLLYAILYFGWMRTSSFGENGRVFIRWLHPTRFIIFVLDCLIITVAEASIGLHGLVSKNTGQPLVVNVLSSRFRVNVASLNTFFIVVFLVVPIGASIGLSLLVFSLQSHLRFSRVLLKYQDQHVLEIKAFSPANGVGGMMANFLGSLPIIGRLLDVEIKGLAPILRSQIVLNDQPMAEPIVLRDDKEYPTIGGQNETAPWFDTHKTIMEMETKATDPLHLPDVKYYPAEDNVQVNLDDEKFTTEYYPNVNAGVTYRFPNGFIGWIKQQVLNIYGQPVQVNSKVLLKHLAPVVLCSSRYTIITPRENLEMLAADDISNLISTAQKGNLFWWSLDRLMLIGLIVLAHWVSPTGPQALYFAIGSAILLLIALPAVFATSATSFYNQMERDYRAHAKTPKYEEEDKRLFDVWPFHSPEAQEQYTRMLDRRKEISESNLMHRLSNNLYLFYYGVTYNLFYKTRMAKWLYAYFTHQGFTETAKMFVATLLFLGSSSTRKIHPTSSSSVAIIISCLAILCVNTEAFVSFYRQFKSFSYDSYMLTRTTYLILKDLFRQPGAFTARMRFYFNQLYEAVALGKRAVSFIYPGFTGEVIRDYTISEVTVVNNELGLVMPGHVESTRSMKRKQKDENNALGIPRYGLQKTLFKSGTIGVFREEIDRSLPIQIPFEEFVYNSDTSRLRRLVATIQVVNHGCLRYIPEISHGVDDDSFLSLYTDPNFVPPPGYLKHTLVVGHTLKAPPAGFLERNFGATGDGTHKSSYIIRGPGLRKGVEYRLKVTKSRPPVPDDYSVDSHTTQQSEARSTRVPVKCHCDAPGVLMVPVADGCTPDLQEPISITTPTGNTSFDVDPLITEVTWDAHTRVMTIRSRYLTISGEEQYTVTWDVKQKHGLPEDLKERSFVCPANGILPFDLPAEFTDFDTDIFVAVRDSKKTQTIDINPRHTNAHEFSLSAALKTGSACNWLAAKQARFNSELDTLFRNQALRDNWVETVPCTIVQCVDPVAGKWRIEPDFEEAVKKVNARREELMAMRTQIQDIECLPEVWYAVMSPAEFVQFWSTRGLEVLVENGRYIDPTREPEHPIVVNNSKAVRDGENALRLVVDRRLQEKENILARLVARYAKWAEAYWNMDMYEAQLKLDRALAADNRQEIAEHRERVAALKDSYHSIIPDFIYPMIVDEKMISRRCNWQAQFDQWDREVQAWLLEEENVSQDEPYFGGLSCLDFTRNEIQFALRYAAHKPEELVRGRTQTVLHYVTSSRAIRGMKTLWRPDPLGAMLAAVRVWVCDASGKPVFAPEGMYYLQCLIKLTGNAIKIMLNRPIQAKYSWQRIHGWYIPLKCFEKIETSYEIGRVDGADTNPYLPKMTGKLVFRRNLEIPVDDEYVKVIGSDEFGNEIASTEPERPYKIMVGYSATAQEARNLPLQEQHSLGDRVSAYPLTMRLYPRDLERWQSVIWACGMYRRPQDVKGFDGRRPRPPVVTPVQVLPPPTQIVPHSIDSSSSLVDPSSDYVESSVPSIHITIQSPQLGSPPQSPIATDKGGASPLPAALPPTPKEYKGEYQNWRYMGPGKLADPTTGKVVYDGGFKDGQRYGKNCRAKFRDRNGDTWEYDGGFWMDEFAGPGKLRVCDGNTLDKLRQSQDPTDKWSIVAYEGEFVLPPSKMRGRGNSIPFDDKAVVPGKELEGMFGNTLGLKNIRDDVSSATSGSDGAALLALDPRRALSVGGDENALAAPMKDINEHYNDPRGKIHAHEGAYSDDDTLDSFKDAVSGKKEFFPASVDWARLVDPTLGYRGIGKVMGKGTVTYANGCRFCKYETSGLVDNKPSGKGYFYCDICPLRYYGYMEVFKSDGAIDEQLARPHGQGIMIFKDSDPNKRIVYKGGFKNGKRHGFGAQEACGGMVYMEGYWENDVLSGPKCYIAIEGEYVGMYGLRNYVGPMKNGLPHGHGTLVFPRRNDYVTYVGEFDMGVRKGRGVMKAPDGKEVFIGSWDGNRPNGYVQYYMLPDGRVYTGMFEKGNFGGLGKLFSADGGKIIYDGLWEESVPSGRGYLYHTDGDYEGEFYQGKKHGKGIFKFRNQPTASGDQRIYEGTWKNDKPDGAGAYRAEDGKTYVLEFSAGAISEKSIKKYKDGLFGKAPKVANPVILPSPVGQHQPEYWERLCEPDQARIQTLSSKNGFGIWAYHEAHPMEFRDPSGLGVMPPRPDFAVQRPSFNDGPVVEDKSRTHLIKITVRQAVDLPVVTKLTKMDPYVKILFNERCKVTSVCENGHTRPSWTDPRHFPWIRTNNIWFMIYDKNRGRSDELIAQGTFELAAWLDANGTPEQIIELQPAGKVDPSQPKPQLYITIEQYRKTDIDNISEDDEQDRDFRDLAPENQADLFARPADHHLGTD